jgi:hypothetical protein
MHVDTPSVIAVACLTCSRTSVHDDVPLWPSRSKHLRHFDGRVEIFDDVTERHKHYSAAISFGVPSSAKYFCIFGVAPFLRISSMYIGWMRGS